MSLSPNTKLGHYMIISRLGAGGMGEVYLAQDTNLDRKVAIKFLNEDLSGDRYKLNRFIQEAKAASALNHPNILTIYEIGEVDGKNYIATELIEGKTLRHHLSSKEPLPLITILKLGIDVAEALSAAHQAGIVHRDIKPDNIMLRHDGIAKVLDFGLAKLTEQPIDAIDPEAPTRAAINTDTGIVMGTATYMSPEQARGLKVDARTDIFSLGVVLYETVTGRLPFEGSTSSEVLASILSDKVPQPLARYAREVPTEFERIVEKALRKDRDERYQTMKDLLLDLKSLKEDQDFEKKLERSITPELTSETKRKTAADVKNAARTRDNGKNRTKATRISQWNVVSIIAGLLIIGLAVGVYFYFSRKPSGMITSVAVMPFINENNNADVEYLADGLTETLIGSLSQLQNLSVKARSSVFRYKGKEIDPKKIGRELSVQAVLTGRVSEHADQFSLSLELVDAQAETVIWSGQYQRLKRDLASVQSEIARDVSDKLRQKFTDEHHDRLAKRQTNNAEAYQLYLKGRYHWNKRTKESLKHAVEYFQQAIEKDPGYALAYAALADSYTVFSTYDLAAPNEAYTRARLAAQKALEIDPTLGEAYATLADVKESFDWDFKGSERDYQKAISLAPNYATAHQWYGELLRKLGRPEQSIAELRRAQELDPLSLAINHSLSAALFYAHRYDDAITQARKVIELDPNFAPPYRQLGWCYTMKEMYDEAIAQHQKAVGLSKGDNHALASLAYALAKSGDRRQARKDPRAIKGKAKKRICRPGRIGGN